MDVRDESYEGGPGVSLGNHLTQHQARETWSWYVHFAINVRCKERCVFICFEVHLDHLLHDRDCLSVYTPDRG